MDNLYCITQRTKRKKHCLVDSRYIYSSQKRLLRATHTLQYVKICFTISSNCHDKGTTVVTERIGGKEFTHEETMESDEASTIRHILENIEKVERKAEMIVQKDFTV